MKNVIISTILTAGILVAGSLQAKTIDPSLERDLVKICEAIKSDSVIKVVKSVKNSSVGIKQIAEGLVCNGHDPVSFAMANDALKTAQYMAKKSRVDYQALVAKL